MKAYNTTSYRFLFVVASRESNPYLKFRKLLFYPLNYKAVINLLAKITVSVDLTRIKIKVPSRHFKYSASIGQ